MEIRQEERRVALRAKLREHGLEKSWGDVGIYLDESDKVLQRYGPLLLATGMMTPRECDLPTGELEDRWDVLSFLTFDSGGASRLAVHACRYGSAVSVSVQLR